MLLNTVFIAPAGKHWGYAVIKYGRIMAIAWDCEAGLFFLRQIGYIRPKSLIDNEKSGEGEELLAVPFRLSGKVYE